LRTQEDDTHLSQLESESPLLQLPQEIVNQIVNYLPFMETQAGQAEKNQKTAQYWAKVPSGSSTTPSNP
jgi:hypothetical protein